MKKTLALSALTVALFSAASAPAAIYLIDFGAGAGAPDLGGTWTTYAIGDKGNAVAIADSTGSLAAGYTVTANIGWANSFSTEGWVGGDVLPWVDADAATDGFRTIGEAVGMGTITFNNLENNGKYMVEVLSSYDNNGVAAGGGDVMDIELSETGIPDSFDFADGDFRSLGKTGDNWNSLDDARPSDGNQNWLVWNSVTAQGESFVLRFSGVTGGVDINAIRITEVPEPHEYAMVAGLLLVGFGVYRRVRLQRA